MVNNVLINQSDIINLTVSNNITYQIKCLSVSSKPDVNLVLYDTNTDNSLGNGTNTGEADICDSNDLCTKVYEVDFQLPPDSIFINMNSITCLATSTVPDIHLTFSIQRNVNIINPYQNKSKISFYSLIKR